MSLDIRCEDHLEAVRAFAHAHDCETALQDKLDYLSNYGEGKNICTLFHDFAPNSFQFLMAHPDGSRWFNGGLIYSGPGQPLDGSFPALTVNISCLNGRTDRAHRWSVHT
jgi:hypothetical protein